MRRALALALLVPAGFLTCLQACKSESQASKAGQATGSQSSQASPANQPEGTKCATPEQARAYSACRAASGQTDCKAKGGTWVEVPLFSFGSEFICACELPDRGCPCKTSKDCVAQCIAPGGDKCKSNEGATCQSWSRGGCRCLVDDTGRVTPLCAD